MALSYGGRESGGEVFGPTAWIPFRMDLIETTVSNSGTELVVYQYTGRTGLV